MNVITRSIPNTITCLNLLSGCLAVVASFHGPEAMKWAWIFMGAAAVFDFCDGAAARLLKAYSAIGKELDSLSDLVSFGLAPGMLVFNLMTWHGYGLWAYAAFFLPVMGALRLAKFNVDTRQTTSFLGLPIPSNAIFWIGATAWCQTYGVFPLWFMIVLIADLGMLMVCNLPMFSLKFQNFRFGENLRRFALILGAVVFVVFQGVPGLAWVIILYILLSLIPTAAKPS